MSCSPFTWLVGGAPHLARASQLPMVTLGPAVLRLGSECPSPDSPAATHPGRWSAHSVCSGDFRQLCGVGGGGWGVGGCRPTAEGTPGCLGCGSSGELGAASSGPVFSSRHSSSPMGRTKFWPSSQVCPRLGEGRGGPSPKQLLPRGGGGYSGAQRSPVAPLVCSTPCPTTPRPPILMQRSPFQSSGDSLSPAGSNRWLNEWAGAATPGRGVGWG